MLRRKDLSESEIFVSNNLTIENKEENKTKKKKTKEIQENEY